MRLICEHANQEQSNDHQSLRQRPSLALAQRETALADASVPDGIQAGAGGDAP